MLRLPRFEVATPATAAEAVAALARPGARLVAGGTDLLPNLKHRLERPEVLVSLSAVRDLRYVEVGDAEVRIGAGMTLTDLSEHADIRARLPSLAHAAGIVASPSIRAMGTIGGNLNLDTRCRYVNQTAFWRSAIGGCLKSEGDVCHVVPGGRNCVAAMSSDCAPVLITLDARILLRSARGERELALEGYYNTDGTAHLNKQPDELLTEVRVPLPAGPRRAAYAKWTVRRSIDFPLVSCALRFDLDADSVDARITGARICVGVLNAQPRLLKRTETLHGRRLSDPATADALAGLIAGQCKPLDNVPYEAGYRRKMLPVHARRALQGLVAAG
jgi:4-hydroxybenzoyl-CoA reductase subunit beta